jgi:hypothetical protein
VFRRWKALCEHALLAEREIDAKRAAAGYRMPAEPINGRGPAHPAEAAVLRVEPIRPYNIDLMSAEKVGNP